MYRINPLTIFLSCAGALAFPTALAARDPGRVGPLCRDSFTKLESLLPFKRASPKNPEYGFPLDLKGYPLRTVLKARAINFSGQFLASVEEVGAGHAAGNVFQFAGQASTTLVDSVVTQAQQSANIKHNNGDKIKGSSISIPKLMLSLDATHNSPQQKARAADVAAERYKKALAAYEKNPQTVPPPLAEKDYTPGLFTLANTVTTSWEEKGGRGYIGLRFNTRDADGTVHENEIIADVRMFDKDTEQQKIDIGIFSTNLAFAAIEYRNDPQKFMRSLSDDLRDKRSGNHKGFEIDMIRFRGEGIKSLVDHNVALDLDLLDGGSEYVMFRPKPASSSSSTDNAESGIAPLEPVGLDSMYGGHYLVVDDDLDPLTPHAVETPAFIGARNALARSLNIDPKEIRVISQIAVAPGRFDRGAVEQNLKELERAGSAVVIHRPRGRDTTFLQDEVIPGRGFGSADVHVYQTDGSLKKLQF